ncbi:MAG: tetratricopeptide repeat protein [Pseudomonadota bacterium]
MSRTFTNRLGGALLVLALAACAVPGALVRKPATAQDPGASTASQRFASLEREAADVEVSAASAQLFDQALAQLRAGEFAAAIEPLSRVTRSQPELSGPWLNLGLARLALGESDAAEQAFERAIRANPMNCNAYNELGVLERENGEIENAEAAYLACLDRDPSFAAAHLNLGILYELYLGRLPDALDSYRSYQQIAGEEDPKVKGWIVDLERRL